MRIRVCLLICAAAVASLLPIGTANAAPQRWAACGEWREVRLPETYGFPDDLAVVSPTEAWLAAYVGEVRGFPAVLHWTGMRWERVSFPKPGPAIDEAVLSFSVAAADDVYAVGSWRGRYATHPLVAHWDGSTWSIEWLDMPKLSGGLNALVVARNGDLLAVGSTSPSTFGMATGRTIVLRRHEGRWSRVPSPTPGRTSQFSDAVLVGDALWAVGSSEDRQGVTHTLAARRANGRWRVFVGRAGSFQAVTASRTHLVWAVGPGKDVSPQRAFIMRWDGSRWTTVRRLLPGTALQDVVAASSTDTWTVGYRGGMYGDHPRPLVMRRDGSRWTWSPAPEVAGRFFDIAGTPHNLWALLWAFRPGSDGPPLLKTFHRC